MFRRKWVKTLPKVPTSLGNYRCYETQFFHRYHEMQGLVQPKTRLPLLLALKEHSSTFILLLFNSLAGNPAITSFFVHQKLYQMLLMRVTFFMPSQQIVSVFPVIKTFNKLIL